MSTTQRQRIWVNSPQESLRCHKIINIEPLLWRHNRCDGVSNHRPHHCSLNCFAGADQTKHQSSASLAFVRGIYRWPVNSPYIWPVTREMFPFDDVIMTKRNKPFAYLMGYACQTRRGRMLVAGPGRWLICLACCPAKCSINSETYGISLEYIHHK